MMFTYRRFFNFLFGFCLLIVSGFTAQLEAEDKSAGGDLKVLRVTPAGEDVAAERQVVIQFSRDMVPLGRMERTAEEVPVSISPAPACKWRWLNGTTLACQLDNKDALKRATRYTVVVKKGIKSLAGSELTEDAEFSFGTARPAVRYAWFGGWKTPGSPFINVVFDQEVKPESVRKHMYLQTADGRRFEVSVSAIEDTQPDRWQVAPVSELPAAQQVNLKVGPGIVSAEGGEPGVEDRVVTELSTFDELRFKGIQCQAIRKKSIEISAESGEYDESEDEEQGEPIPVFIQAGQSATDARRCNPMRDIALVFTSPVPKDDAKGFLKVTPDLGGGKKGVDPWENVYSYINLYSANPLSEKFLVYLPGPLFSITEYRIEAEAGKIKDIFGRTLQDPIDIRFRTDHRPPRFHLGNQISVLEKETDSHLPLITTNIKSLGVTYESLKASGRGSSQKESLTLYDVKNIAYRYPLKIRELLSGASGIVQGMFEARSGKFRAGTWFFSQVTPFHVHAKAGHFNSLVWVTDFKEGKPVKDAKVSILTGMLNSFDSWKTLTPGAQTDAEGIARLKGLSEIDPKLKHIAQWRNTEPRLLVKVEKGNDIAILPLMHDFDVSYSQSVYPFMREKYAHIQAWGTTAQGVYRLGDTIQYKILVRNQDISGFVPAPKEKYSLEVHDPTGKVVLERKDVSLSDFGAFDGVLDISKNWAVGWYRFVLKASFSDGSWEPLTVLISDFTPSPYRVSGELDKKLYVAGNTVSVETSARLHAGGPFADAAVRVTANVNPVGITFEDPKLEGFFFESAEDTSGKQLYQTEGNLDSKGDSRTEFKLADNEIIRGVLVVESAVRDDRGKYVASTSSAKFFGRDRLVGIRQKDWVLTGGNEFRTEIAVTDPSGNLLENIPLVVAFEFLEVKAARVKGAGNAYLTNYESNWVPVSECKLTSGRGIGSCGFTPGRAGSYRIVASVKDSKDREHRTTVEKWAGGSEYVLWQSGADNLLTITPEKNSYKAGETARYMVQNPFPGAKALVTVERYGTIESRVTTLEKSVEVLEVPVTEDLVPGFYFSVVVMSPRADKPVEDQVDLGKPSFKIGYVTTNVDDKSKELQVTVRPERESYKPRDTVQVNLEVKAQQQKAEEFELAVAVLDESVFDLIQSGKSYFDSFKGFYVLDSLDLKNYNIIRQLVGRQKFEKKGANPGGSGGADLDMRSIFKFVSYWNPSVRTDKNGKASVSFQVPDNLTGWRVLVMAADRKDRFGLGDANFKVNQSTEIRPALPNQVMEGDDFTARFTVMNRMETGRTVQVEIGAGGSVKEGGSVVQSVRLEPFKRETVSIPLKAGKSGEINFSVRAYDDQDSDGMTVRMPVLKRASLETGAIYGTTMEKLTTQPVEFPADMRTDAGDLSIVASASAVSSAQGAFQYMKDYPYSCWEQRLSKALSAAQFIALRKYLPAGMEWDEAEQIIGAALTDAGSYQAPNGGMAFYVAEDSRVDPYLSAYTGLAFHWLSKMGYKVPQDVSDDLDAYLKTLLERDVLIEYYTRGMLSSARAVALHALAARGGATADDVKRYAYQMQFMDLFGKAHFLSAAAMFPGTAEVRKKGVQMIYASSNETSGKVQFSEAFDTGYARIMSSELRSNCAVLSALIENRKFAAEAGVPEDAYYKLMRFISESRGQKVYWHNTQENIFCSNAIFDYSRAFESVSPDFKITVSLDDNKFGEGRFRGFKNQPLKLSRYYEEGDPGRKSELKIEKDGRGRLYYAAYMSYAPGALPASGVNSGIEVSREYSVERGGKWELLKSPFKIKSGELVKVDIYLSLPAARNFVVVADPVPGGLEPVNRDLATASSVDADKGERKRASGSIWFSRGDWETFGSSFWGFYHKELRHDSARFYSEYLPQGNYHLSYTAQAIAPGTFTILPSHTEEMYDPDVYGKSVTEELRVE